MINTINNTEATKEQLQWEQNRAILWSVRDATPWKQGHVMLPKKERPVKAGKFFLAWSAGLALAFAGLAVAGIMGSHPVQTSKVYTITGTR